ncbi:S26 family signal peptidase [Lapillicoccus jejuensis]|uniref:Peptidase S24-like protein n=1 Tax=Lapillicoccus jejuensis TaxID=402171 RepID=A0A542DW39_9MICO|nr:S26 family signal peptidase [Lapillicoccus jejuensis]TQJ07266.1 peptidase S24-like protein [Lapillicoccus jejuensis]
MRSLRVGVVRVTGRSMEPSLHEGDRLVVLYGAPPVRGRLAVVRLPDGPDGPRPVSVKRVTGRAPGEPGSWWVERDNHAEGLDSWTVGGIPRSDVLGVVVGRVPDRLVRLAAPRVTPRVRGGRRG